MGEARASIKVFRNCRHSSALSKLRSAFRRRSQPSLTLINFGNGSNTSFRLFAAIALWLACSGIARTEIWLAVPGIDGASTAAGHVGQIEIVSFNLTDPTGPPNPAPGIVAFTKLVDAASSKLSQAVASGTLFSTVTLYVRRPDSSVDHYRIDFSHVFIIAYMSASGNSGTPTDTCQFSYASSKTTYFETALWLSVPGIEGDSTDPAHAGQIELLSYSWTDPVGPPNPAPGSVTCVKLLDVASSKLSQAVASGTQFSTVTLYVRPPGALADQFRVDFSRVLFTAYAVGGTSETPIDTFTFIYETSKITNFKTAVRHWWRLLE